MSCSSLAVDLGSLSGAFSPTLSALRKKCTIVYPNAVRPLKQATQCSAFRLPAEAFSCAWLWHFWMRLWGSGKNVQLGVTPCTPDQCLWGAPTWAWLRDGCLVGCWGGPFPRGGGGGGAQCCSQRAPASFAELAGGGGGDLGNRAGMRRTVSCSQCLGGWDAIGPSTVHRFTYFYLKISIHTCLNGL